MQIRICDRCKEQPNQSKYNWTILSVTFHRYEPLRFNWLFGKEKGVEICENCFRDFWNFKDSPPA